MPARQSDGPLPFLRQEALDRLGGDAAGRDGLLALEREHQRLKAFLG